MADEIITNRDVANLPQRFKDMGDGTYAEVMAFTTGSAGSLPSGTNTIGNVGLLAGTNGIGSLTAGSARIGSVDVAWPTTGSIFNTTLAAANTEYPQELGADWKKLEFQAESYADVRFAFATGLVATPTRPYAILKAGDAYTSPDMGVGTSGSIFFATPTSGSVFVSGCVWK